MKNEKNNKIDEYISIEFVLNGLISGLSKENEILRKKLNNEKLTEEEKFFDDYILPPSSVLQIIKRRIKK